ncbi:unnamed protein product [Rangifer tarandus platyrhynchus]|uniref:Uncharacterized protein n=1 Tax=Rangifer tarandus platyrhynchus TaxID=3082113 RepID=A0AC59YWV8_RANTA
MRSDGSGAGSRVRGLPAGLRYLERATMEKSWMLWNFVERWLLIPPVMKQLYELSPSRTKRLAIFPDGTHNDTWQCQGYFTALEQFIRDVMKSPSPEEMAKASSNMTII